MGFFSSLIGAVAGGGSRPRNPPRGTTAPTTDPNASIFQYYAYLNAQAATQANTAMLYGAGQQQTTTLALASLGATSAGERSQMTTYVVLGVVMLGVAGMVALARR